MKLLVIGGGGREHALVWKLKQSPLVEKIWCTPGNGGIEADAECLPADPADVPALVAYISEFMTLLPGDVISTGTPPGVGLGMKPPQYLKAGDVVELGIDGLGESRQEVVDYR